MTERSQKTGLVRPTRYSLSLISFGSPMITFSTPNDFVFRITSDRIRDRVSDYYGFPFAGDGCGVDFGCGGGSTARLLRSMSQTGADFAISFSEPSIDS